MKIDATLRGVSLGEVGGDVRRYEDAGFDGVFVTETNANPFLPIALAARDSGRIELGTGIALAFPRSPMDVAYTAWDLQSLAGGRFILGLGSQVRAHVERRFSSTWSHPARRMAEYIQALRAIWLAWQEGTPLDFRGEFFTHTLMPPEFRPTERRYGAPRVMLAGVGERMVQVAAEHADGLLVHVFHTPRYLQDTVLPTVAETLARHGRRREDFEVSVGVFVATTEAECETARRRIAFYGSTPGYRRVLELHGWGDLHIRLHELSRSGDWDRMAPLVDDDVLDAFCIRGSAESIGTEVLSRYGSIADRINLHGGARSNLDE